jgi:formylglycine-generating enzyme required for sulfatase activity
VTRGYDLERRFSSSVAELEQSGQSPREVTLRPMLVLERLGVAVLPAIDEVHRRAESPTMVGTVVTGVPSPTSDAPLGERLGRYEITGELGSGGMGRVVAARDPELGRNVALKVLRKGAQLKESGLAQFVTEARLTAQLEHPNIVPVHEIAATADGQVFFSMKQVEGRSLGKLMSGLRNGEATLRAEWTTPRLLGVFLQVCHGLAYAHARGVLHRDLTPANIMCGAFGEVLVMDWGLARVVSPNDPSPPVADERSERTLSWGTPGYRSPEQIQGHRSSLSPRSDVWSLGAILYELLTLQRAYPEESLDAITAATLRGPIPDPRRAASVPDELAEVCLKAMARDPRSRYPDAGALGEAVQAYLEGSHRREQAHALLDKARASLALAGERRQRAAQLRQEAAGVLARVNPTDGEEVKAAGWKLEDEAAALEDEAALDEARFLETARAALERAPDLELAHRALADHYRLKHEQSSAARDARAAAGFELLLRAHDRGAHEEYLAGTGRLTLLTDPPDAEVEAVPYVLRNRRLVLDGERGRVLGRTPLASQPLHIGSYLLKIRAEGRAEVHLPINLGRGEHWRSLRPGSEEPFVLPLPPADALGPDDVLVPAGWAPTGGDAGAAGGFPARNVWIDAFVLRRFPVTHGEWLEFLDDLVARGDEAQALRHAPRETAAREGDAGELLYGRDAGRFVLDGKRGWQPNFPVCNVEWASAHAYARWCAEKTGLPWRLPCELEWEKAARGADGRVLPWGWFHDPTWCATVESHAGPPHAHAVTSFPVDESPYGVRGLAGGIRDWCLDVFSPEGPVVSGDVLALPSGTPDPQAPHITRGGAWSLPAWVSRAAVRGYHPPIRLGDLGLRLCRSYGG